MFIEEEKNHRTADDDEEESYGKMTHHSRENY